MVPLSDDEGALVYHVGRFGSSGYPVAKLGSRWVVTDWRSVKGPPTAYRTRREAVAQFEAWHALALERWRAMKAQHPDAMLTGVGIRGVA